jgi:hypothetical protein
MGINEVIEAPIPEGMGELAIMDPTGDTKIIFDPENEDEVAAAKATFDTLKGKGFAAFRVVGPKGEKGDEIIREFDPKAGRMIMIPALAGG